jgi:hypothetical protein
MDLDRFMRTIAGIKNESDVWSKVSAIPISAIDTDVEYGPPDPVHIIGYPLGWAPAGTDKSSSAFWRTSWIASEMNEPGMIQANGFFIDPCALQGMTGSPVVGMKNERMKLLGVYSDLSTDHPIDLTRYQVINNYMGRAGLINSGGASGENDFAEAAKTAVINKRAGGMGLISGRKAFQRPMSEGVKLLNTIQDVYLSKEITIA